MPEQKMEIVKSTRLRSPKRVGPRTLDRVSLYRRRSLLFPTLCRIFGSSTPIKPRGNRTRKRRIDSFSFRSPSMESPRERRTRTPKSSEISETSQPSDSIGSSRAERPSSCSDDAPHWSPWSTRRTTRRAARSRGVPQVEERTDLDCQPSPRERYALSHLLVISPRSCTD